MKKEVMKKEWLLDDIKRIKEFVNENNGDADLMIHVTRSLFPLLEEDPEIEIEREPGENIDHLYIRHGRKIDGKYQLKLVFIF